ncbi:hypothetical protein BCV73_23225 [Paenibacillus sp. SSG-1]|nr:hypothetical protein BCV73_23225 [Paenibacillus sp. SSG-1]
MTGFRLDPPIIRRQLHFGNVPKMKEMPLPALLHQSSCERERNRAGKWNGQIKTDEDFGNVPVLMQLLD